MLNLLLKPNEIDAIYILGQLVKRRQITIEELEAHLAKDKSTIRKKVDSLNESINSMGYCDLKITTTNGIISIQTPLIKTHSQLPVTLCEYYIKNSPTYKVIYFLLKHNTVSQELLLSNAHISESYLNKILKKINNALIPFQVTLCSRNKAYVFEGSISHWIHIVYYTRIFLSSISPTLLPDQQPPKGEDYLTTLHFHLQKSVAHFQLQFNQPLHFKPSHTDDLLSYLINQKQFTQDGTYQQKEEWYTYLFYSQLSLNFFDEGETRQIIVDKVCQTASTADCPLLDDLLLIAGTLAQPCESNQAYQNTVYFLFTEYLKHHLFNPTIRSYFKTCDSNYLLDKVPNQNKLSLLKATLLNLPITQVTIDLLLANNCYVLSLLYLLNPTATSHKSPITLFVTLDLGLPHLQSLKDKINAIFSEDTVAFVSSPSQASLIISDYYWNTHQFNGLFYLLESTSTKDISALSRYILELVNKKA